MRRGPRAVGDLLINAVPALRERLAEVEIRAAWPALVGADAARRSRPQSVTHGCLQVVVDNSPWLQELTLRSGELTARVAGRFGDIRTLRFTLGPVSAVPSETRAPVGPRTRALNADELREIDAAVAPIRDPDARAAARRLLGTARRSAPERGVV